MFVLSKEEKQKIKSIAGDAGYVRDLENELNGHPNVKVAILRPLESAPLEEVKKRMDSRMQAYNTDTCLVDILDQIPELEEELVRSPDALIQNMGKSLKAAQSSRATFMFLNMQPARHKRIQTANQNGIEKANAGDDVSVYGAVTTETPLQTRQEIIGSFCGGISHKHFKKDLGVSLARLEAFTQSHEFEHGVSYHSWKLSRKIFTKDSSVVRDVSHNLDHAKKFNDKVNSIADRNDPYMVYFDECISDAAGALVDLRDHGDDNLLKTLHFARSTGALNYGDTVHDSSRVSAGMLEHLEDYKNMVHGKSVDEIHAIAQETAGRFAFRRDQYYLYAAAIEAEMTEMGSGDLSAELLVSHGKGIAEHEDLIKENIDAAREWVTTNPREYAEEFLAYEPEEKLTPEDYKVELAAAIDYVHQECPQYRSPQATNMLLRYRDAEIKEQSIPDDMRAGVISNMQLEVLDYQIEKSQQPTLSPGRDNDLALA